MDALRLLTRSTNLRTQSTHLTGHTLPSEGQQDVRLDDAKLGQKRKRGLDESTSDVSEKSEFLSPSECREIQQKHKIRIVDLKKSYETREGGSRKAQKESCRIFPQPLLRFTQLKSRYGLHQAISDNIRDQGYYIPTPVQMATIPLLLENVNQEAPDLLTVAPTGSGKTIAFLIPLIEKLIREHAERTEADERGTRAIILAPTKELVHQIVNEGRKLTKNTGITITAMRKGMKLGTLPANPTPQLSTDGDINIDAPSEVYVKSDILVSAPLGLVHGLEGSQKPYRLPHIQSLILDEADVLLDPLFRTQTLDIWEACTSPSLQTSLWSATIGSSIEELAITTISQRQERLNSSQRPPLLRTIIGLQNSSLPTISHKLIYAATEPGKLLGLRQLLHPSSSMPDDKNGSITANTKPLRPPFLVFTQTIERAAALHQELLYDIPAEAGGSSRIAVLHASLSDTKRSDVMTRFRKGQIWILITTDLLSRGVDFRGVNGVVNYDIPTTSASYVHRAGRTGRAGRDGGVCVTFYTKEDIKYVKTIANIISLSEREQDASGENTENSGLEKWLLDALPDLSQKDRKELKERGVSVRRAIKESDDVQERRMKRKARIGTKSGYEKKLENNRRGAIEANRKREPGRRPVEAADDENTEDWDGLSD